MSVYHQMGNDSFNLIRDMPSYVGAILSPVNDDMDAVAAIVRKTALRTSFELIFDPQLYFPRSQRGQLGTWNYFPKDVDTADVTSESWWHGVNDELIRTVAALGISKVCSPACFADTMPDDRYTFDVECTTQLCDSASKNSIHVLQTAIVRLPEVAQADRPMRIASILSRTAASGLYVVFHGEGRPRDALAETEQLKGAMRLLAALKEAGIPVLVGFAGPEIVLWKAAGAADFATGKFFNVRRFTRSRFDEEESGGGQLPYWFEEALMTYLRDSDLDRVSRRNDLSLASLTNPFGQKILEQKKQNPKAAWIKLGWRQYMHWFGDAEARIQAGTLDIESHLIKAEQKWVALDEAKVLMEEVRNNGAWVRAWRRALVEYKKTD